MGDTNSRVIVKLLIDSPESLFSFSLMSFFQWVVEKDRHLPFQTCLITVPFPVKTSFFRNSKIFLGSNHLNNGDFLKNGPKLGLISAEGLRWAIEPTWKTIRSIKQESELIPFYEMMSLISLWENYFHLVSHNTQSVPEVNYHFPALPTIWNRR